MRKMVLLIVAALLFGGCATTEKKNAGLFQRYSRSRELGSAVELMRQGNPARARQLLAGICEAPPVPSVTDEACFRAAVLTLKYVDARESYQYLRRLKKEFPLSPWTVQAQPLTEYVTAADEQRRMNRTLKGSNLSLGKQNETLGRENEELKKRIDQMKNLDLELGRTGK